MFNDTLDKIREIYLNTSLYTDEINKWYKK